MSQIQYSDVLASPIPLFHASNYQCLAVTNDWLQWADLRDALVTLTPHNGCTTQFQGLSPSLTAQEWDL